MRFKVVQNLKEEEFRRLTGVKRKTFNEMAEIVEQALPGKKSRGGRPNRLSAQDMILMTLDFFQNSKFDLKVIQTRQ